MLQGLSVRANNALGAICDESAPHPHESDYASHLNFFTDVVTRLEGQAVQACQLVEGRNRGLVGREVSRVFSNLLDRDSQFDFNAVLALVPAATQDKLARWVDDHVNALVKELASEDETVVLMAGANGTGSGEEEDGCHSSGSVDEGDEEGALG